MRPSLKNGGSEWTLGNVQSYRWPRQHCEIRYEEGKDELNSPAPWILQGTTVNTKRKHKYLGILLSADICFKSVIAERDAMVIQLKSKVIAVRETMGESMAMLYIDTVLKPMILYGMELITVPAAKLTGWQSVLCSAAWFPHEICGPVHGRTCYSLHTTCPRSSTHHWGSRWKCSHL